MSPSGGTCVAKLSLCYTKPACRLVGSLRTPPVIISLFVLYHICVSHAPECLSREAETDSARRQWEGLVRLYSKIAGTEPPENYKA